ncbi:aminopeptidase [Desulfocurvibacter africanus]|uniref:aminopeptidase n=1 Tax=Desulfocurvibacter africanus TaxID=873 RepID=UPI000418C5BB|nr:aminopeptidase [Desulfocurvibacter africanus]
MTKKKNAVPAGLESEPKSCWEIYDTPAHEKAMEKLARSYVDFLSRCKTERESVEYVVERLKQAGFKPDLSEAACYRVKRDKTIFIARKGKRPLSDGFRFLGAHADTPRLDLKQHPLYQEAEVGLAKTHYYGGIRKHQWLARPLALHGVAVKKNGQAVTIVIGEDPNDPVLTIADLLPHLAYKQVEQKLSDAFEAEKLNVIFGHSPAENSDEENGNGTGKKRIKRRMLEILDERYGLVEDDLYSAEMHIVPAGPARFVGLDRALIGGYGHDDRVCLFAALEAFLRADQPEYTQVVVFWDKEEIGSEGSTGAKSKFFEYCLMDMLEAWEPKTKLHHVMELSKAVSADVHGALDPDFQELHDKLNAALLGYGPCFCKFTGHRGKVGANDAHPEYVAWLRNVLDEAGVPWQMAELGRVDLGGGGTVAKYLAEYGMDIIDFGTPVLSMHSPFEIISKVDLYATTLAYEAFLKK